MERFDLYNKDCMEVLPQLTNNSIDLIVTDPPYGVNFSKAKYDDNEDYINSLIPTWFTHWKRLLKEDGFLFIFVGVKNIHTWIFEGINAGFTYKNILATRCYDNSQFSPDNNFGFQFQPILIFSNGVGKDFNDVNFFPVSKCWLNDNRNKNSNIYSYNYPNWIDTSLSFSNTHPSRTKNLHPNQKNVKMLKFLIQIASDEDDVILDNCMGSGSTGVACMNTGRRFVGIEKEAEYFDIAQERILLAKNTFDSYSKMGYGKDFYPCSNNVPKPGSIKLPGQIALEI